VIHPDTLGLHTGGAASGRFDVLPIDGFVL